MRRVAVVLLLGIVFASACDQSTNSGEAEEVLAAAGIVPSSFRSGEAVQDSSPMVVRRVWGGPDVDLGGSVTPDGRYLTFIDWGTGNVALREVATGEVRLLTDDGSWKPYESAEGDVTVSPDGKRVAYLWYRAGEPNPYELRVVGMDGSGRQVLYRNESADHFSGAVWSPDGQQILTVLSNVDADGTDEMVLISLADRSAQMLKRFERNWPSGLSFSPDGRYIAYDLSQPRGGTRTETNPEIRDIFVHAIDGARETPLVQHPANDFVLGWAPDGKHILFASDRTGTVGAWVIPVADGKATGSPKLVKPDMWRVWPMGFTQDGSFFYGVNMTARDVYVTTLDPETGQVLAPPTSVNPTHLAYDSRPDWSPDGRYLKYYSGFGARIYTGFTRIACSIRSVETGETRELVPDLNSFGCGRWIDGHSLLVPGKDRNNRVGAFKVDVHTGEIEPLPAFWDVEMSRLIGPSPDGMKVFYTRRASGGAHIMVMDLETGRETPLYTDGYEISPDLSPDGRHIAFVVAQDDTHRVLVMRATGGEPQEVHRYEAEGHASGNVAWSRDGKSVFYPVETEGGHQLWRVSVAGGPAQRLEVQTETLRNLRVHPDGRRIAFDSGSGGAEVWVMENFLPSDASGEPGGERRTP
ncbi:MAG: PD40 domain-containing protein [Gemmatimonadota bacterium]|nr:MAG: PD40 domain-containing protein [Gemmatimonadota bacterium]